MARVSSDYFLMFLSPLHGLAMYDEYLWSVYSFFSVDAVISDRGVSYLFSPNGLFKSLCW